MPGGGVEEAGVAAGSVKEWGRCSQQAVARNKFSLPV